MPLTIIQLITHCFIKTISFNCLIHWSAWTVHSVQDVQHHVPKHINYFETPSIWFFMILLIKQSHLIPHPLSYVLCSITPHRYFCSLWQIATTSARTHWSTIYLPNVPLALDQQLSFIRFKKQCAIYAYSMIVSWRMSLAIRVSLIYWS
jgi:hypothetical protein